MNQFPPPITQEMLELFAQGRLDPGQAQLVMQLAMTNPIVAAAVDVLKRAAVDKVMAEAKAADPQAFVESGMLEAYLQGGLAEQERQMVELMSRLHPVVAAELQALEEVHATLLSQTLPEAKPKPRAKDRFMNFMEMESRPAHQDGLIRPPFLSQASKAEDYLPWTSQFGPTPPADYDNSFVQPLDADADCMTLLVWVKREIAGEVHLDAVEKFLVLEGTCRIDIEGEEFLLQAGDYMSIPKFKEHTVYVTSEYPCKLIVQQIAA